MKITIFILAFGKNNKKCGFGNEFLFQKTIIVLGFWKDNFNMVMGN